MFQSRLQFNMHLGGVQSKSSSDCPGTSSLGSAEGRADARVGGGVSHPSLQLTSAVGDLSPFLGTTCTWTAERSRKPSFSRILGSYIISTYIQYLSQNMAYRHRKKRLETFPYPAGTSLTKLSLGGNNLIIPAQLGRVW